MKKFILSLLVVLAVVIGAYVRTAADFVITRVAKYEKAVQVEAFLRREGEMLRADKAETLVRSAGEVSALQERFDGAQRILEEMGSQLTVLKAELGLCRDDRDGLAKQIPVLKAELGLCRDDRDGLAKRYRDLCNRIHSLDLSSPEISVLVAE